MLLSPAFNVLFQCRITPLSSTFSSPHLQFGSQVSNFPALITTLSLPMAVQTLMLKPVSCLSDDMRLSVHVWCSCCFVVLAISWLIQFWGRILWNVLNIVLVCVYGFIMYSICLTLDIAPDYLAFPISTAQKLRLNLCDITDKEVKIRRRRVQTSNWEHKGTRKV